MTPDGARSTAVHAALALAVAALFVAPYALWSGGSPARYLLPDLAIAALLAWRFRSDAPRRMGLAVPLRQAIAALALLGVGLLLARAVVERIAAGQDLVIRGARPGFSLSQVLHQEIVLRGLLLGALVRWIPSRPLLALAAAVVFTGVHPLLFWWSEDLRLPATALATLFGFAVATNLLFLRAGHVAFSFAVHAAWNLARFGEAYRLRGRPLSEAQSFVAIEGSTLALAAAALLLASVAAGSWIAGRTPR